MKENPATAVTDVLSGEPLDKRQLRDVLGSFVTGVTVVTTVDTEGKLHGLTANSFSSVSLDPPLVLWSQAIAAGSHAIFRDAPRFAINILAEDQYAISNHFAKGAPDKFSGIEFDAGIGGLPLLRNCSAWLECNVVARYPGGDHLIFVGEVKGIRRSARRPLVFGGGRYLTADPHDLGATSTGTEGAMKSQPHATRLAQRAMASLARTLDKTLALVAWGNHGPTVVAWQASPTPVAADLPLGLVLPATSSASGLALAAFMPRHAREPIIAAELQDQRRLSGESALTDESLALALEGVRESHLATRRPSLFYGDRTFANAFSVPVLSPSGEPVFALTAIGRADQFDADPRGICAEALKATAREISASMTG